jgi:AcrR family transcriptional regulator
MVDVKTGRKAKAAATRRRMLDAARDRFASAGYPGTTMAAIAQDAGVAVQTLYFTFHTKAELLGQVFERAVTGDEGLPPQLQDWYRAAEHAHDLDDALRTWATGVAAIVARVAPLRPVFDGVGPDEDVVALWARGEALREQGYRAFLDHLVDRYGLAAGADRDKLLDVTLVLLGPVGHRGFVEDRGWTVQAWVDWSITNLRQWFP